MKQDAGMRMAGTAEYFRFLVVIVLNLWLFGYFFKQGQNRGWLQEIRNALLFIGKTSGKLQDNRR
jgi:hypothetical protein